MPIDIISFKSSHLILFRTIKLFPNGKTELISSYVIFPLYNGALTVPYAQRVNYYGSLKSTTYESKAVLKYNFARHPGTFISDIASS